MVAEDMQSEKALLVICDLCLVL